MRAPLAVRRAPIPHRREAASCRHRPTQLGEAAAIARPPHSYEARLPDEVREGINRLALQVGDAVVEHARGSIAPRRTPPDRETAAVAKLEKRTAVLK